MAGGVGLLSIYHDYGPTSCWSRVKDEPFPVLA
jgi:hypothetical protein